MSTRKPTEDRKADIIQATFALAFEVGPEQVTTGMIAERLGLTQPAIYKHFPRKEDIWRVAAKILSDQIAANIALAKDQGANPIDHLRLLVLGHLRLVFDTPALPEIMVARDPRGVRNAVRMEIQSSMTAFSRELTGTIEQAQADGRLRPETEAKDMAALIFGVIQSLVLRMLVTRNPLVLLQDGERLLDLQLSAFAHPGREK